MKSPFPGMDPYLETRWGDVRLGLIVRSSEQINPRLPREFPARCEYRYVENDFDRFTKIIDITRDEQIVTAIEVLTPWNRCSGELLQAYREALNIYARTGVNVIEIDLLRTPRESGLLPEDQFPERFRSTYRVTVRRGDQSTKLEVYPLSIRQPLPSIRVPLRKHDADVLLDLQQIIDQVYVAGGHDDIDYNHSLDPPLPAEDEAWADALLRAAGRRT